MKILVVEDEPLIRIGLASLFEESGYSTLEASNADEAIRAIEHEADLSVIVTDVDMPGSMDGVRLAHFVRDRWPPIKLVVISGKIGVSSSQLPPGARFFTKPCRDDVLLAAIRDLSAQRGPQ